MSLASSGPIEKKKLFNPLATSLLLVTATLLIVRQSCLFSESLFRARIVFNRTQNSELRILFNIIHEDCNKLVIVTIIKITVIKGKKYETKYIILFNKKKL